MPIYPTRTCVSMGVCTREHRFGPTLTSTLPLNPYLRPESRRVHTRPPLVVHGPPGDVTSWRTPTALRVAPISFLGGRLGFRLGLMTVNSPNPSCTNTLYANANP